MKKKIILSILMMLFPMAAFGFTLKVTNSPASDIDIELQTIVSGTRIKKLPVSGPSVTLSPGKSGELIRTDQELLAAAVWKKGQYEKVTKENDIRTIMGKIEKGVGKTIDDLLKDFYIGSLFSISKPIPQNLNLKILAVRGPYPKDFPGLEAPKIKVNAGAVDLATGHTYNLPGLIDAVQKNPEGINLDKDFYEFIKAASEMRQYAEIPGVKEMLRHMSEDQKEAWQKAKKSAQQAYDKALKKIKK